MSNEGYEISENKFPNAIHRVTNIKDNDNSIYSQESIFYGNVKWKISQG